MVNAEQKVDEVTHILGAATLTFGQGVESAYDEAMWMVFKAVDMDMNIYSRAVFEAWEENQENLLWQVNLTDHQISMVDRWVEKRVASRIPFAYLVNESWFAGYRFYVDSRVIIPRSYFSEWIPDRFEPWVDSGKVKSILDLCTGSGCIAISCALFFPQASVIGSDIDWQALEVAKQNIDTYDLGHRVSLALGDGFDSINQRFDLILCNPPYVSDERMERLPDEFLQEPDRAFRGGEEGLDFIISLLEKAGDYLTETGVLIVEAGSASNALEEKYPAYPFTWISTEYDEMVVFIMTVNELKAFQSVIYD